MGLTTVQRDCTACDYTGLHDLEQICCRRLADRCLSQWRRQDMLREGANMGILCHGALTVDFTVGCTFHSFLGLKPWKGSNTRIQHTTDKRSKKGKEDDSLCPTAA